MKTKKVILFGTGDLAQIAKLYFERDTEYEVKAFVVDRHHMAVSELMGLPVTPYDEAVVIYPSSEYEMHVCLIYNNLNRDREAICDRVESRGYKLASYISPHSFVAPTVKLGNHHFIFENNVIQDFVEIGDNVIFWSGNHTGHSSKIGSDIFISSHCVIGGNCRIGSNCFIGVNSTLANNTVLGKESWVSHGSILSGIIPDNSFVKSVQSEVVPLNEKALSRALERAKR